MTCRSLTCFSLFVGISAGANVTGRVELADSREASVKTKKDYSGVAIWLEPVGRTAPLPAPRTYTVLQKGKRFLPHVTVIPVGATVDFPNLDPIFHNAFSNFAGQQFDTGLYPPGSTHKIRFQRDGIARVFCNIHSTMSAVIVVLNTPWFAVSAASGAFEMTGVPEGEYLLRVWHERADPQTLKQLEKRVTVPEPGADLPPMTISESGYLQLPHKNKYGRDYGPEPPEHVSYTGLRK